MKAKDERKLRDAVRNYGFQMVMMQRKLINVGLVATAQAVNKASQQLGWEAARILEREAKP